MGFRFKLEALLKHRATLEDQAQRELAKSLRQRMILQQQIRQMQDTIRDSKRQLGEGLVGTVDLDSISRFAHYSGDVAVRAQHIVVRLGALEKQITLHRTQLAQAMRARKAIELLRARHHERWQLAQQRHETAAQDEIASQRFVRRQMVAEAQI